MHLFGEQADLQIKFSQSNLLVPQIGAIGTPISTLLFYAVTVVFNLYFVFKYTGVIISVKKTFIKPLIAALTAALLARLVYDITSVHGNSIAVVLAIAVSAVSYTVLVFVMGCIETQDIAKIPHGDKISAVLMKLRLLR